MIRSKPFHPHGAKKSKVTFAPCASRVHHTPVHTTIPHSSNLRMTENTSNTKRQVCTLSAETLFLTIFSLFYHQCRSTLDGSQHDLGLKSFVRPSSLENQIRRWSHQHKAKRQRYPERTMKLFSCLPWVGLYLVRGQSTAWQQSLRYLVGTLSAR